MSTMTHTVPAHAFDGETLDMDTVRGWVPSHIAFTTARVVGASAERNGCFDEDSDFLQHPNAMEAWVIVEVM